VLTSGNSKWVRPPTHNQGVVGSYPAGPTLKIKHLQGKLVGVFFFTPGRRQDFEENREFVLKKSAGKFVYF